MTVLVDPAGMMFSLFARRDEANNLGLALTGDPSALFGPISFAVPSLRPCELGFLRLVSWLYVLYHEVGPVGTKFLSEKIDIYNPPAATVIEHPNRTSQLRTYLQHNLDPLKKRDSAIRIACEDWFNRGCGSSVPTGEEQWCQCLKTLIAEAEAFLTAIIAALRGIETDADRESIIGDWHVRLTRYHPPHRFDELITSVAGEMGRNHIDSTTLRKRLYDKWTAELRLLKGGYDFNHEARKLIEHELLTASVPVLPITGRDIMTFFSLGGGKSVGGLLQVARRLYNDRPCPAQELLERVSKDKETPAILSLA